MAKILIIKTGYSETFDNGKWQRVSSLGDVLRTTTLLHLYKGDNVTWLTDEKAIPLLEGNLHVNRILIWDALTLIQLQHEYFDTVINLEKVPGLAALADHIGKQESTNNRFIDPVIKNYGYHFDKWTGESEAGVLDNKTASNWQKSLFSVVGRIYQGEEYILGYKPKLEEQDRIGLNFRVGLKWPSKRWPDSYWKTLKEELTKKGIRYSMQPIQTNIYKYIDWINSCKVIVTCDSLGLHIAMALKKKVVALFGPTPVFEEFFSSGRIYSWKSVCDLFPCRLPLCTRNPDLGVGMLSKCMSNISVDEIISIIETI